MFLTLRILKRCFLTGVAPEFRQEVYITGLKLTLDRLAREVEFAQKDECPSGPASPEQAKGAKA
jgi:uncharacterized membrane protein YgcG